MLLRPNRPLPRRFNRRVRPETRAFVERRHKRKHRLRREQWQRYVRRSHRFFASAAYAVRKWALILVAGILLLMVGLVIFSPLVRVQEITVQRSDPRVDIEDVQRILAPMFGRHLLFLPAHEVRNLLLAERPDIENVDVSKVYPWRLFVSVEMQPLIARLEIDAPQETPEEGAVPVAESGAIVDQSYDYLTTNGIYVTSPSKDLGMQLPLIRIVDWGGRPLPLTHLLPPDMFMMMDNAERALTSEFGHEILSREIHLRAREFHLETPQFTLWFDTASPLDAQLKRYRVFLQTVGVADVKEYIDLRIASRVVYR
ncbi:MAG: hypothetical protein Q7R81_07620 [Candidatus Peregrinibacteria bacterium]|nr:hypothetical protein [Candidatus Peregrinibacteria bacterium]